MLENKKIFITGASKGIGKALAIKLAQKNNQLYLTARNVDSLKITADEINKSGQLVHYAHLDVTDKNEFKKVISEACEKMGNIDLAILNAGISYHTRFTDYNTDNLRQTIETNVFGVAYGMEQLIPIMKKQGRGIIAGISSIADFRGVPGSSSYSASKTALSYLLESARPELKPLGIDIVTIRFGFVDTDMVKKNHFYMPFMMSADKAADKIADGLEKGKKKIQFPWQMVLLSNLVRLLPYQIYEYLAGMRLGKQ